MTPAPPGRRGGLRLVAGLACLLLWAGSCYDAEDHSPTEANIDAIITLTTASGETSLPADGVSRLRLVARLLDAPAAANRTVLFHVNGFGTLEGGVADGDRMAVDADAGGRAVIDFVAGQDIGTAVVTASPKAAPGITVSLPLTLQPADPDSVLRFVRAPATAPADGATLTTFTVEVTPELPAGSSVGFAASVGGFGSAAAPTIDAPVVDGNRASADLQSLGTISTVRVTASVLGVTRATQITFERALPDGITVTADPLQAPAAVGTQVAIAAVLHRDVGAVTDGTVVTFGATDDSGAPVGTFGNVTRSTGGQATATFLPGTDQPGFVTITVGAEGSPVTGSVRVQLTGP